jgi:hypothetical protein
MKIITKLIIAAAIVITSFAAQAGWVSGYYRNNGTFVAPYYRADYGSLVGYSGYSASSRNYVYRNPYAAYPSVHVSGYTRADGVTVLPNLSYRGFGTIRVPRYSTGW